MEQIFDVLGPVAILVFIAIGKLIETVFKGKQEQHPQRRRPSRPQQHRPSSRPSGGSGDIEDVQERIRRLIMERAGIEEDRPPQASYEPEPEPEYFEPVVQEPRKPLPPPPKPPPPRPASPDAYSLTHNVRKPSANLKKLGLGTKEDLRKAVLQREILGPPLALREEQKEQW